MADARPRVRLRQAVIAALDLEAVAGELRQTLGLEEPFRDPGVGMFGLANTVFAIGDCFLEVISPSEADTAAGRWIERRGGDGGYMVIFDLEDLDGARARAQALGVRTVWKLDLPDISGTHLHPADMRGAIVSIDQSRPFGSWRWGGPAWTEQIAAGPPGRLAGITVAVPEPAAVAARWAEVLGVAVAGDEAPRLILDGGEVLFREAADAREEGIAEIVLADLSAQLAAAAPLEVGGVSLRALLPA